MVEVSPELVIDFSRVLRETPPAQEIKLWQCDQGGSREVTDQMLETGLVGTVEQGRIEAEWLLRSPPVEH
ncbi:MAG TPA: hypothetical protein VG497_18600, partial [Kribbella sp.]|nr:hypothetical protein [Kribbella sp.]